jgi:glutamine---fructose-6-phosphate transaminase (isomerizing)
MTGEFRSDVAAQGSVVRGIAAAAADPHGLGAALIAATGLLGDADRPIVLVGMGSSLHAGRTALPRFAAIGRWASAIDAGELLHFGLSGLPADAALVLVSQSGRSAETVALAERLRSAAPDRPILAIVNDLDSPLARLATLALPMGAGVEAAVATRTFLAASVLLQLLADGLAATDEARRGLSALADALDKLAASETAALAAADRLADVQALELVGRGATLGIAHYGALTIKETGAFPAEALSGGAFRHGPLELVDAPAGAVVLVPAGPTGKLAIGLAREIAAVGWSTWVIGAASVVQELTAHGIVAGWGGRLVVTAVPDLRGPLAALPLVVPLQQLAAILAERRGRVPGLLLRGSKVTDIE